MPDAHGEEMRPTHSAHNAQVPETPISPCARLLGGSRESELALCAAVFSVTGGRGPRMRELLRAAIDWDTLTRFASQHAILPLVYSSLRSFEDGIPADAAQRMRRQFQANGLRNILLARELVRLSAILARAGIQTIAFKGPALAALAYGTLNLRQFVDLDLLVRKSQLAKAVEVMRADGYVAPAGYGVGEVSAPGAFETSMVKPGSLASIDLHWRLAEPYFPLTMETDELWQRAETVELEGNALRTLALDDHLLYLCAHGARHGWETLSGVCDVAQLMRAGAIDWGRLRLRAERVGARRMLLLGVLLVHELLEARVPEEALTEARDESAVVRGGRTFIAYAADPAACGPGLYQRWSIPLRMIERPGARARYLAARMLLPGADDRSLVRLPRALAPLYYVLRPLRIVLKGANVAARRLRPSGASPAGSVTHRLAKFRRLPRDDRNLLLRAALTLAAARLALKLMPLQNARKAIVGKLGRLQCASAGGIAAPSPAAERIVWAIETAGRALPGGGNCLLQALAAEAMMLRAGHHCELRIGVAKNGVQQMAAHAWLVAGDGSVLIGDFELGRYHPLASPVRPG